MKRKIVSTGLAVLLSAAGCSDEKVTLDDIITMTWDTNQVYYADGLTPVLITIAVNEDAGSEFQNVSLSTNAGTFVNGTNAMTLDLSFKHSETVELIPGTVAESFFVKAEVGDAKKYASESVIELMRLSQLRAIAEIRHDGLDTLVADGEGEVTFYVKTGVKSPLKFQVSPGGFHQFGTAPMPELTVDPDEVTQIATAIFHVGQHAGAYKFRISTTDANFDSLISVQIKAAYADHMMLLLDKTQLDHEGDQVNLKTLFSRPLGKVSIGQRVKFMATVKSSGTVLDLFSVAQAASGEDESAATVFSLEADQVDAGDAIIFSAEPVGLGGLTQTRTLKVF